MSETETKYCSGCGKEKPLAQFQVTKQNRDGAIWVKERKWCLACCEALFTRQKAADARAVMAYESMAAEAAERKRALGPLPPWVDPNALDYLVNGPDFRMPTTGLGWTQHEFRANQMLLLWGNFQKHERAAGDPVGGRGSRFIKVMACLMKGDEVKFRQKLRRMCKHNDNLSGVFETASTPRRGNPQKLGLV